MATQRGSVPKKKINDLEVTPPPRIITAVLVYIFEINIIIFIELLPKWNCKFSLFVLWLNVLSSFI